MIGETLGHSRLRSARGEILRDIILIEKFR